MKIISGNSNRPLAEAIAAYLDTPLTQADVRRFADMEVFVEIHENVRGEDVFVVQSTSYPANDNLMELLVTLDARPEIRSAYSYFSKASGKSNYHSWGRPRSND
jgi:ribose-phosphate pyrophosphokinase